MPVWKPIARLQSSLLAHPGSALTGSLLLFAIAVALGAGVEFRSSRADLAPAGDPDQRRMRALLEEFHGSGSLVVCIEAEPGTAVAPERLRRAADELAAALAADERVAQVFHRVEGAWLLEHGLYLVPAKVLRQAVEAARARAGLLRELEREAGLESINRMLARVVREGLESSSSAPGRRDVDGLSLLTRLLEAERRLLEDPDGTAREIAGRGPLDWLPPSLARVVGDGYLRTVDGRTLFLVVSPRSNDDSLPVLRDFVGAMRRRAAAALAAHPGIRVAFTGQPAISVEEMDTVRRDTALTSALALIGVTVLTFLVFHRKRHSLLVLMALVVGLGWAFGAVRLELGYLNMVTSSFLATLIGVGVAYGIHPVSEYELTAPGHANGSGAVREAYRRTGPGVTVAAVTTSAAFFSILLMRFRGFAELGLVAGVGVLLCLLSFMVTLPALLTLLGRGASRNGRAMLDRVWDDRAVGLLCRFPRLTTLAALTVTALALWSVGRVGFDTNILKLLPANSESLRYLRRMIEQTDFSPMFNMVATGDLAQLREMQRRAAAEPSIARFDSILHFIPEDPRASSAAVEELRDLLPEVGIAARATPARREAIVASLASLEDALDEAAEAAFTAGLADLLAGLERAHTAAGAARRAAADAPEGVEERWTEAQQAVLDAVHRLLDRVRLAAAAEAPTIATVPAGLRERFVSGAGRFIGFLFPVGSVFDRAVLEPYIAACRRVSEEAIGPPMMFWLMSNRITSGFYRAVAVGTLLVVLVLLADFRSLRDATLAMIPLAMGVSWMIGGMRLLGLELNFANLVGVPLIIGVGIDNGVHVVHRLRLEGREGMNVVLRHTGRAIVISSLTTMIGFGSLALASHVGLASLGKMLLLGVGACLLTSIVVLPNLLVALGVVRR